MAHDPANLKDSEATAHCGGSTRASHDERVGRLEQSAMRSILALSLLITLCASAEAAAVHHHSKARHVVVGSGRGLTPGLAVPGWAYAAPRPPGYYDDTPSYNDPSKFGGQSLGIDP